MLDLFPSLADRLSQQAETLSGGEQQMLAIGRALMADPAMLVLDEPTLGLAPFLVDDIFEVLKRLNDSHITILLVEQNARRSLEISHYGYLMENGRIVSEGTPGELQQNETIQKAYLGLSDNWIDTALKSRQFRESKNRLGAVVRGEVPDRTPVVSFIDGYPAVLAGAPLYTYYTDIEESIRLQIQAKAFLNVDDSPSYGWADWGGWEFGGKIRFPQSITDTAPRTEVYPVTRLSQVDSLKLPDPETAGMFPRLIRFNRLIRSLGYPAKIRGGSVSSLVGSMVPVETLAAWIVREPDAVHCLFDKAAEFILRAAALVIETYGAENCSVFMSTPWTPITSSAKRPSGPFPTPGSKKSTSGCWRRGSDNLRSTSAGAMTTI